MLYTWNKYNIVSQLHLNNKKKTDRIPVNTNQSPWLTALLENQLYKEEVTFWLVIF